MLEIKISVHAARIENTDRIVYLGRYEVAGQGVEKIEGIIGNTEPRGAMFGAIVEATSCINRSVNVVMPPIDIEKLPTIKEGIANHGTNTQEGASDADLHDDTTRN
jgi:hypothetical protein